MKKMSSNFKQRLTASTLGILLLFAAIYFSMVGIFKIFFVLLVAAMIGTALWEFYHIAKAKGYAPLNKIGIIFTILYVFAIFISTQIPHTEVLPLIVMGLTLLASFLYYFIKGFDPFVNLAITLFGIFYLTLPLSFILSINYFFPVESIHDGRWWVFYLIAVTKMTDIGAYFFGKLFGSHPLTPYISPRKTWEGAIGGLFTALATSLIFYGIPILTQSNPLLTLGQSLFLGFGISLLAQFGDLAESLLKRDLGVKDSNQLPGLGGILDILDSLVFTIPFVYIFLKMTYV
jgi:phosphatidate cytidylyltransferase